MRRLIVVAVTAAALAGCGGSGAPAASPTQQVTNVTNHFTVDVGQKDYAAACKLTTGAMRQSCAGLADLPQLQAECKGEGTNTTSVLGRDCAALPAQQAPLAGFTSLTVSKVVVSGPSATVAFSGSSEVMQLAKRNGRWLVSSG